MNMPVGPLPPALPLVRVAADDVTISAAFFAPLRGRKFPYHHRSNAVSRGEDDGTSHRPLQSGCREAGVCGLAAEAIDGV